MELKADGTLRKVLADVGCVLSSAVGRLNAKYNAGSESIERRMKTVCTSKWLNKKGAISKASIGPESCKLLVMPNAMPKRECCNAYPKVPMRMAENDSPQLTRNKSHATTPVEKA